MDPAVNSLDCIFEDNANGLHCEEMDRPALRPRYSSRYICQLVENAGDDESEDNNAIPGE